MQNKLIQAEHQRDTHPKATRKLNAIQNIGQHLKELPLIQDSCLQGAILVFIIICLLNITIIPHHVSRHIHTYRFYMKSLEPVYIPRFNEVIDLVSLNERIASWGLDIHNNFIL